jgi:hypothetical protein
LVGAWTWACGLRRRWLWLWLLSVRLGDKSPRGESIRAGDKTVSRPSSARGTWRRRYAMGRHSLPLSLSPFLPFSLSPFTLGVSIAGKVLDGATGGEDRECASESRIVCSRRRHDISGLHCYSTRSGKNRTRQILGSLRHLGACHTLDP